jgi:hypothetical protein
MKLLVSMVGEVYSRYVCMYIDICIIKPLWFRRTKK